MSMRSILITLLLVLPAARAADRDWDLTGTAAAPRVKITVYRSPTCTCCGKWLQHMQRSGFIVDDVETEDMAAIKDKYQVPAPLRSCHTATIDDYVLEGHVPAADVRKLLKDKPKIQGLAVPGMPVGTPGMQSGERQDAFSVLQFEGSGESQVFHAYPAK